MEIVLLIENKNYQKVRETLLKDSVVSLASIVFKDARITDKEGGYYCYINGLEDQCKRALELAKDLAKEVEGKEKEDVISKIKDDENRAIEGFGNIFG
jgi:hypothetical protein